jgi:ABC-type branched-subunit amino acid transport system substrate-binding protein
VLTGDLVNDSSPFFQGLGSQIPVVISAALTPADFTLSSGVTYLPGIPQYLLGFAKEAESQPKGSRVVVVSESSAAAVGLAQGAAKAMQAGGMTNVKVAQVPSTDLETDVVSALQSAGVQQASAVVLIGTAPMYIDAVSALRSLGATPKLVLGADEMLDPAFTKTTHGALPANWKALSFTDSPLVSNEASGTNAFIAAMKRYGAGTSPSGTGADQTFSALISAIKVVNQAGATHLAHTQLLADFRGFTGKAMMQAGTTKCGVLKAYPTLCGTTVAVTSYKNGAYVTSGVAVTGS